MKISFYTALLLLVVIATACEKEKDLQFDQNNNSGTTVPARSIAGNYDVVGVTAITLVDLTVSEGGVTNRAVTRSHYFGKNVEGTAAITNDKINLNNVAYAIDTVQYFQMYVDGVLIMDDELPFQVLPDPQTSGMSYVWNTADSLTFSNFSGGPVLDNPGPVSSNVTKIGAKASWSGDTLLLDMYSAFNSSVPSPVGGAPGKAEGYIKSILKLKKK